MENPENDHAVFRPFHKPWESKEPIPTFPPPRLRREGCEKIPGKEPPEAARLKPALQAHFWIGKDSGQRSSLPGEETDQPANPNPKVLFLM